MLRASKTAFLFGIAALAALASGPNPSLTETRKSCDTLLFDSDCQDSIYNSIRLTIERQLHEHNKNGALVKKPEPIKMGMGTSTKHFKQTLAFQPKTLSYERPLGKKQPVEEAAVAAKKAVDKFNLQAEIPNHQELLAELQKKLLLNEGDSWNVVLSEHLRDAKSAARIHEIFHEIRDFLEGRRAELPLTLTRRTLYKYFDQHGNQTMEAHLAVRSEEAGWMDVCHVSVTTEIEPVTKKKVKVYTASAGKALLEGRLMHFPKMSWMQPPEGITAKEWAEIAYGTILQPMTVTTPIEFTQPLDLEGAKRLIEEKLPELDFNLSQIGSHEKAAQAILSEDGLTLTHHNVIYRFKRDPSNPNNALMIEEVCGGQQRVYLHPTDPGKLVKVIDHELMPIPPENIVKILQWNLGVAYFFNEVTFEQIQLEKKPDFLVNAIVENFTKLAHGASEVKRFEGEDYGESFNIEDKDLPPDVVQLFAAQRKYQFALMQVREGRYGPYLVFAHIYEPSYEKHVERFGLPLKYDSARKSWMIIHGLDVGAPPTYGNIRRMRWKDGYIGIYIDF